jgi:hypothetical protein
VLPAILKRASDPTTMSFTVLDTRMSPGPGESLDSRRDVHRHPRQRAPLQLAFASVYTDPDVDTETLHGLSRRPGTFERARRGIEADKEPVARRVDLGAFASQDLGTYGIVMLREDSPPAATPRRRACSVEPTMSVKSSVARMRFTSLTVCF